MFDNFKMKEDRKDTIWAKTVLPKLGGSKRIEVRFDENIILGYAELLPDSKSANAELMTQYLHNKSNPALDVNGDSISKGWYSYANGIGYCAKLVKGSIFIWVFSKDIDTLPDMIGEVLRITNKNWSNIHRKKEENDVLYKLLEVVKKDVSRNFYRHNGTGSTLSWTGHKLGDYDGKRFYIKKRKATLAFIPLWTSARLLTYWENGKEYIVGEISEEDLKKIIPNIK